MGYRVDSLMVIAYDPRQFPAFARFFPDVEESEDPARRFLSAFWGDQELVAPQLHRSETGHRIDLHRLFQKHTAMRFAVVSTVLL